MNSLELEMCEECCSALATEDETEIAGFPICYDCFANAVVVDADVSSDECGYCGLGLDPEIICQSCWDSMQQGDSNG